MLKTTESVKEAFLTKEEFNLYCEYCYKYVEIWSRNPDEFFEWFLKNVLQII